MTTTVGGEESLSHAKEVASGERFRFGENWSRFLRLLNDQRIAQAETSLKSMLGVDTLKGKRFVDIGSGSGLFSLVARRLGASVVSFDYDPSSVACTRELRRRYFPEDPEWQVLQGSALEADFVTGLGQFDIVYSWGVLHHTGSMWLGLDNASKIVAPGGRLFVAIYNDCGSKSKRWLLAKKIYNRLPSFLQPAFAIIASLPGEFRTFVGCTLALRPFDYFRTWSSYASNLGVSLRGMSKWHDIVDWVGGYPYEYAKPEEIFDFYRDRGFVLTKMLCGNVGIGCNEFVFVREDGKHSRP